MEILGIRDWQWGTGTLGLATAFSLGVGIGVATGFLIAKRRIPKGPVGVPPVRERSRLPLMGLTDEFKLVFVVRTDLKMGKGKVAAQCGHAAIEAYKRSKRSSPELLERWERTGCAKVVLKAPDEDTLDQVAEDARRLGLTVYVVADAGRTQIAPGSRTVLSVGPGRVKDIDKVTGTLKLY